MGTFKRKCWELILREFGELPRNGGKIIVLSGLEHRKDNLKKNCHIIGLELT
jgi:hypothetical protein